MKHFLLLMVAPYLAAQHSETSLTNPFNAPEDRVAGGAIYRSQCANCHGIDGKGGAAGPNLAAGNFRHATSDESMFSVISKGVAGTSMPGFSIGGQQVWQTVAYVRSLNSTRVTGVSRGNAEAGGQLFRSQRCLNCHSFNGEGSSRGVDLSKIAARLSPDELRLALTDPSAAVAPEYWIWQAVTTNGKTIRGSRLNEDSFSVQILDSAGKLRTVAKTAITKQSLEKRSPMPSFKEKLTEAQLEDLVAFLGAAK